MSKQSKQKTKQDYSFYLLNYEWGYQLSLFIDANSDFDLDLIDLAKVYSKFRKAIARKYLDQPFLFRVQVKEFYNKNSELTFKLPILVIFTTKKIKDYPNLTGHVDNQYESWFGIAQRKVQDGRLKEIAFVIKGSHGHRIDKHLELSKPNRYSICNKSKLIPIK